MMQYGALINLVLYQFHFYRHHFDSSYWKIPIHQSPSLSHLVFQLHIFHCSMLSQVLGSKHEQLIQILYMPHAPFWLFHFRRTKFVSCGDDKKIFLWEFGVPVIIRNLNEQEVEPITRTVLHPCQNYFVGQTTDNKLLVFDVKGGSLRFNRKKRFVGHVNAGFSIRPIFSPNGFYLISGDHPGNINVWDWKSERKLFGFQAHNSACVELDWHPNDSSMMVSGGYDNVVRLWLK